MVEKKHEFPDNNITIGLVAGGFPLENFQEWELDCKKQFGNCRWLKIWHDHKASKVSNEIVDLYKKINDITDALDGLADRLEAIEHKIPKESQERKAITIDGKT